MGETITGVVERTYCAAPAFSAGLLRTGDGAPVRFRGKFYAAVGDHLSVVGVWKIDPKYGHQFEVQRLDYELPQTRDGLANYLAKHPAFAGIGEKTAERIAGALDDGESLDDLLRDRPEALRATGVPASVIESLATAWASHASENAVRSYLAGFDLTHHQMETLLTKFGASVVSMLKDDPYLLIKHLSGYGFKRVDQIALKMGVAKTHPGRIEAAISYCLWEQIKNGHTWTPGADLVDQANDVLIIDSLNSRELIGQAGARLIERGDCVADGYAVTTPRLYDDELLIRSELGKHAWALPLNEVAVDSCAGGDLDGDQHKAFQMALSSRVSVISGGAGTGKTYVVARLTAAMQDEGMSVCLCAPTGKASTP